MKVCKSCGIPTAGELFCCLPDDYRSEQRCVDDARINVKLRTRTPLHTAVIEQQTEVVSDLIDKGVKVNARDFDNKTALDYAVQSRNLRIIKVLLDAEAKIFKSSLLKAVETLNVEILALFLNKIGDLSTLDSTTNNCIQIEPEEKKDDDSNNDVEEDKDKSSTRCTPLELAVRLGNSNIVELLLNSGASLKLDDDDKSILNKAIRLRIVKILKLLLNAGANVDDANIFCNKPIHLALDPKNLDILQLLLDSGANVNAKNRHGFSPLHLVIKLFSSEAVDCTKLIKLLLKAGADVNAVNKTGACPLLTAVELKNENFVKLLLDSGANVELKNYKEETALMIAVNFENEKMIELLLSAGASAKTKDSRKNTALHTAVKLHNEKIVKSLLDAGADINAQNQDRSTPLLLSVEVFNNHATKTLVEAGADINLADTSGNTPLHRAAKIGNFDVIKMFINAGVDSKLWSIENNVSKTPFMIFAERSLEMTQKDRIEGFKLFLEYSDINIVDAPGGKNILIDILQSRLYAKKRNSFYKLILKHIAKKKFLGQQVASTLLESISSENDYSDYFDKCIKELENAKSTKLRKCRVTFLNLLVDDKSKFVKYAGNQDLVKESKSSVKKFPIYGPTMKINVTQGVEDRKSFDDAADALSRCLPILNPTHLIIRDTLDALSVDDWKNLGEKKRLREE